MRRQAAVVSIGDELMTGKVVDTNFAWIADFLLLRGIETVLHLTVGDDIEKIGEAFRLAGSAAGIVIVSGGLGPTTDDLTTLAFCRFTNQRTVLNQDALDAIASRFRAIGREMTPNNRKQAELPENASMLNNPIGTAPGFHQDVQGSLFFFVPGVPRECLRMIEHEVWPVIAGLPDQPAVIRTVNLRTFGLGESMLDQKLADIKLQPGQRLGYRAVFPEIHVKLMVSGDDAAGVENALDLLIRAVRERVAEYIFSEDDRPLEQVVGDLLRARGLRLTLAESCTGGLLAQRITDISGSSDYFERGYVTYSNRSKTELLGVNEKMLETFGAVSREVAVAMAEGARARSGADLALAVTGIAGPAGGTKDKPVGTVHMALSHAGGTIHLPFLFARPERTYIRELTAQAGLEVLRRFLLGIPMPKA